MHQFSKVRFCWTEESTNKKSKPIHFAMIMMMRLMLMCTSEESMPLLYTVNIGCYMICQNIIDVMQSEVRPNRTKPNQTASIQSNSHWQSQTALLNCFINDGLLLLIKSRLLFWSLFFPWCVISHGKYDNIRKVSCSLSAANRNREQNKKEMHVLLHQIIRFE